MEEVAVARGLFIALSFGGLHHASAEADQQIVAAAFQKGARVPRRLCVFLIRNKASNARAPASLNVILQARARMLSRQVHRTRRNAEVFVNEMNDAVGEAVREKRAEIDRAVFAQPACYVDAGIFFKCGEADVGIGLVVPQQYIEFRLILFDEIIFERQSFTFVIHDDVVHIGNFAHQRSGLRIGPSRFQEIGTHARAQRAGLADVENAAECVLEKIDTGVMGKSGDFFPEIHGRSYNCQQGVPDGRESRAAGNIHDSKANHTCENHAKRVASNACHESGFRGNRSATGFMLCREAGRGSGIRARQRAGAAIHGSGTSACSYRAYVRSVASG